MTRGTKLLFACVALLFVGSLVQWRRSQATEAYPREQSLRELLPRDVASWTVSDEPVAATEEMKRAVAEMLNYDEAIVRNYRSEERLLSVYVASWKPGKFDSRLIALHSPDVCWPAGGWKMTKLGPLVLPAGANRVTPAGRYRRFERGTTVLYVAYWHLVSGEPSEDSDGTDLPTRPLLKAFWRDLGRPQGEQYFIRIAASQPMAEGLQNSPLPLILAKLSELGLQATR